MLSLPGRVNLLPSIPVKKFIKKMEEKVLKTIKKFNLISPGDTVITGLSGGADSVSLLICLCNLKERLGIGKIVACHINHNLRETAKRDEEFSRELCKKYNVDFYLKSADVKGIKKELKLSEEDAGRVVRYAFFNEIRELLGGGKIATAHNLNDQAETFFMRILRGTSSDGLMGIKPQREDGVIRPLIEIKREEIENYLTQKNQGFMTDETNFADDYLRNKIRNKLMPLLKDEFSFKEEVLWDSIGLLNKDSDCLNKLSDEICDNIRCCENKGELELSYIADADYAVLSRVLRKMAKKSVSYNPSKKETEMLVDLCNSPFTGKRVNLGRVADAYISYDKLIMVRSEIVKKYSQRVEIGENVIENPGFIITLSEKGNEKGGILVKGCEDIIVRTRLPGDKIYIKNTGHKKLQDLFCDKKVPKEQRDIYPVVQKGDKIIWVPGLYKGNETDGDYRLVIRRMKDETSGS